MDSRFGPTGALVTFVNANRLRLDGILYFAAEGAPTVVHVHGSFGNFYQNPLVRVMAERFLASGINFLSFNTSGHDGVAEGTLDSEDMRYIGGAVASFEETVEDIRAAVEFVKPFSREIVLQGHSLGCDRVVNYMLKSGDRHRCVLLAPCNSYELQAAWLRGESVESQRARLRTRDGHSSALDWLPAAEYGVLAGEGWTYSNPVTREALLSISEGPPFQLFRYDEPTADWTLPVRALVAIGSCDTLVTVLPSVAFSWLQGHFLSMASLEVLDANHGFSGKEADVSATVCQWVVTGEAA